MISEYGSDIGTTAPTCAQKTIGSYESDFIKSYLYRLGHSLVHHERLKVLRLVCAADEYSHRSKFVTVADDLESMFLRVTDSKIFGTVSFDGMLYDLSIYWEQRGFSPVFYLFILGLTPQSNQVTELLNLLLRESVLQSPYRNNCLVVQGYEDMARDCQRPALNLAHIEDQHLNAILLPSKVMEPVRMFIDAVRKFSRVGIPLRYLFSGRPGTAKTKIIQAIANATAGCATFIFASGTEENLEALFEFAEIFSPLVLCIDDIDLMVGSREGGSSSSRLSSFLQKLDGFEKRNFFLLATANDKRFVDLAARRPGRFDRVIDVDVIHSANYLPLVKTKTTNESVVALFDDEIIQELTKRKVTGAFVANLVKHLELLERLSPNVMTRDGLLQTIEELNLGFNEEKGVDGRVGFGIQN